MVNENFIHGEKLVVLQIKLQAKLSLWIGGRAPFIQNLGTKGGKWLVRQTLYTRGNSYSYSINTRLVYSRAGLDNLR
jgi:hypothetical protein